MPAKKVGKKMRKGRKAVAAKQVVPQKNQKKNKKSRPKQEIDLYDRKAQKLGLTSQTFSGAQYFYGFPTPYYDVSKYNDPMGGSGVRIKWCGPIFNTNLNFGTSDLLLSWGQYNTLGNTSLVPGTQQATYFPISPKGFLPTYSVGNTALSYSRFRFVKARVHWCGTATTNSNDSIALGYNPDGASYQLPYSSAAYSSILRQQYTSYQPGYVRTVFDFTDGLSQEDWFYVDPSSGSFATITDADYRQAYQGVLMFAPNDAVALGNDRDDGLMYSEGEILLVDPQTFNQDYAMPGVERKLRSMSQVIAEAEAQSHEIALKSIIKRAKEIGIKLRPKLGRNPLAELLDEQSSEVPKIKRELPSSPVDWEEVRSEGKKKLK